MQLFGYSIVISALLLSLLNEQQSVSALSITDCSAGSNPDAQLGTVTIAGCSLTSDACPLIRNTNASISVEFQAKRNFRQAKLDVAGKIGVWIPFPIKPDNACGNWGFNCPVNQNERKKLQVSLPVSRTYPKMRLDVRLKLLDENRNTIVCVIFPARIQDQAQQAMRPN